MAHIPSTTAVPNGRFTELPLCLRPNMAQIVSAAVEAAEEEEKPPSVYVAPPTDNIMVLPYVD